MKCIPKKSKLIPSLAEMRSRQNIVYKWGGMEISLVPMRRDEWNTLNSWVTCKWLLHFYSLVELGEVTVPNERKDSQYPMASFYTGKTMGSGEVTLSILSNFKIQGRTEYQEGDSDRELENFFGYWTVLLSFTKNH